MHKAIEFTNTNSLIKILFPLTIFISACLLFVIQPMAAKVLLPVFGGTPAVWTICMLFFQGILLAAYGYAWFISQLNGGKWRAVHLSIMIISLLALPLGISISNTFTSPEWSIISTLILQLGLPMLVIAASAPLLQYAYSQTGNKKATDPYFLYAASNAGSLLALISYPWLIERFIKLSAQFQLWNYFYCAYLALLGLLFFTGKFESSPKNVSFNSSISLQKKISWILYSFIPCSLLIGVSFYISTDIAATPMFWVFPLALYLVTFIITFSSKPLISHNWISRNVQVLMVFPIICFFGGLNTADAGPIIIYSLLGLFVVAMYFHGELVVIRPQASKLTTFYFCISLGGFLAGVFNGLIAPRIFTQASEYPIILFLALALTPIKNSPRGWLTPLLVASLLIGASNWPYKINDIWFLQHNNLMIGSLIIILLWPRNRLSMIVSLSILYYFVSTSPLQFQKTISQQRNFFGIKAVTQQNNTHYFISQSTIHGFQIQDDEEKTNGNVSYYAPVKSVLEALRQESKDIKVLTLGLGAGTVACQLHKNDQIVFIEIDQQVISMANNPNYFTYLQDCEPNISIVQGDGIIASKKMKGSSFDLTILDAFSSDAIPTHLLTIEALQTYKKNMADNGAILINISNRHLNILPVIVGLARYDEMIVLSKKHRGDGKKGQLPSAWALLTFNDKLATNLMSSGADWQFVTSDEQILWTNDYSNIVSLLK